MIIPKKEKHEKPLHSWLSSQSLKFACIKGYSEFVFCFIRWHPIKTIVKLQSYFMFNLIYGIITEKQKQEEEENEKIYRRLFDMSCAHVRLLCSGRISAVDRPARNLRCVRKRQKNSKATNL